ncbi:alpha/beta hydrolase [Streptococcus sp. XMC]|jgi:probable acyltransferase and hydrolase with the alpha/beta hydrolase fold domain protein|uniref:alpha/beta hydrolase n=1 Tax=Streptococcus sp. XMC TaxID=2905972 RepID=UPI001E403EBC|nr:alpha/beta hydrolase [Streptococcus sp. XMC]MCE3591600.1 alpha/beta hydrolase [Streptococcus sp. XMC]
MKVSKKTALVFTLVCLFLLGLAVPSYSWTRKNVQKIEKFYNSKLSPIIMIPGSSATENRFDGLVTKLNQDRQGTKHSLLKVKVWNDGSITYSGSIDAKDNEPIIVIGFENNKDGYSNIKKQAKMVNQAFEALQSKYNFNNFKGLGHSNGGLIYTSFIENYLGDYDVDLKTLMTIGTPYNFTEINIKNKSEMLADFIKAREAIPTTLHMYSVAGTITYDSDELVPDASVSAGKYIYQNQAASYTEITVTGEDAQHSDLPTNDEVVALIKQHIESQDNPGRREQKNPN